MLRAEILWDCHWDDSCENFTVIEVRANGGIHRMALRNYPACIFIGA
jgi:hypothetical protein